MGVCFYMHHAVCCMPGTCGSLSHFANHALSLSHSLSLFLSLSSLSFSSPLSLSLSLYLSRLLSLFEARCQTEKEREVTRKKTRCDTFLACSVPVNSNTL